MYLLSPSSPEPSHNNQSLMDKVIYIVSPGHSLHAYSARGERLMLKANSIIPVGDAARMAELGLKPEDAERLLKKGILTKTILETDGTVQAPRVDTQRVTPVLPGSNKGPGVMLERSREGESEEGEVLPPPTGPTLSSPPGVAPGVWGYDPASLTHLSLIELNQLMLSIDPSRPACSSPEEAIAVLSSDYRAQRQSSTEGDQVAQG